MASSSTSATKQVYLDVCALCRPFDDQQQARIRLETGAVELILAHVRQENLKLIVSAVHRLEIVAIKNAEEREQVALLLNRIGSVVKTEVAATRRLAEELVADGFGVADAAHVAFAAQAGAEFVTVDDRLLKHCYRAQLTIWCGTPVGYCEKEKLK